MDILAHVNDDGRKQTLEEHLNGVAELAKGFAISELKTAAEYLGLIHDIGKCRPNFQRRLSGDNIRCEHACCGAQEIISGNKKNALAYLLAYCAAGHHSGLQNGGAKNDPEDEGTLHSALNKKAGDYLPQGERFRVSLPDLNGLDRLISEGAENMPEILERAAFFTRYLFSCLTDADFLDTENFCDSNTDREIKGDFSEALRLVSGKIQGFIADTDVKRARKSLQQQAMDGCGSEGVHILNMPTGSGKLSQLPNVSKIDAMAHKVPIIAVS
ncbi:MAG: CRISPR-associated endonuclease Cas3'' [Oscillospiraceae bacterium]|nr:CRISPR-associated endonuclease Cas3'' [Oscillospiraceae bacterium]